MLTEGTSAPRAPVIRRVAAAFLASAFLLCVWAYAPIRDYPYITYDDPYYVYENDIVTDGLTKRAVVRSLTERHLGNWYPLTLLSYAAEIQVFGVAPGPQHIVNLALHLAATAVLFAAFWHMSRQPLPSALLAAVFALHPQHVEPVVWISSRKDVLSIFFFALMMLAYSAYVRKSSATRMVAVTICFALGLMAKASLITAPLLLLLLDVWPLRRFSGSPLRRARELLLEKWPLFMLGAAFAVVAFAAQEAEGALGGIKTYPLGDRIRNSIYSLGVYLVHTVWPAELALFYPHRGAALTLPVVALSATALLAISGFAVLLARRYPAGLVGWLWFLIALAPVAGLVQIGSHGMADRYVYLPAIGLYVALAWAASALFERGGAIRRYAIRVCAVGVLIALALGTRYQVSYWRDSETLYRRAIDVTEGNFRAHFNLANLLRESDRLDEAVTQYREAIRARPHYPQAHANLGIALAELGDDTAAIASLSIAVEQDPADAEMWFNLGMLHMRRADYAAAIPVLTRYVALEGDDDAAWYALGVALAAEDDKASAVAALEEALRVNAAHAEARSTLKSLQPSP